MISKQPHKSIHALPEDVPPTILTIFGATGDLSTYKLIPTLVHMNSRGLLPSTFRLVAVGRRSFTPKTLLGLVKERAEQKEYVTPANLRAFEPQLEYFQGDFENPESFSPLARVLEDHAVARKQNQSSDHICYNRLYYFATAPDYFAKIAAILKDAGLLIGCREHNRTIRILVEKPFGSNLSSAKKLNRQLLQFFSEDQIYRIDHYLGKETVQNIMIMRFANDFLEPVWNKKFIDHIEVSVLESLGAGERKGFYDQTGALKDFVQNHILQMLALTCMDRPQSLNSNDIRNAKLKIIKSLIPFDAESLKHNLVRAQYVKGGHASGYVDELGQASTTETFVALKTGLKSSRWNGVPIFLRTGKRLPKKLTEISIHFKKQANTFFVPGSRASNVVTFRIQPDERVSIQVNNKIPGFGMNLHTGSLDFGYKMNFDIELPSAYERLLLDFIQGDQRLFIRSDEIEASWKFIDSITENWNDTNAPIHAYEAGSSGPEAAEMLVHKNGADWWTR